MKLFVTIAAGLGLLMGLIVPARAALTTAEQVALEQASMAREMETWISPIIVSGDE